MKYLKFIPIALAAVIIGFYYFGFKNQPASAPSENETFGTLQPETKTDVNSGVTFTATPKNFGFGSSVEFEINIDTHSGSLDFDLMKVSVLRDNLGKEYQPAAWQGSEPGGHHRSGTLSFPEIDSSAATMTLIINYNSQIIFDWVLK